MFTVARESVYYVNMRQAYLSSPYYAQRLSSRTVLFQSVPERYLDEARIRKLYGDAVRRVWLPRTSKRLANLVKEREQTAMRLEKAEVELIKKANIARKKQLRKLPKDEEQPEPSVPEKTQEQVQETEARAEGDNNNTPASPTANSTSTRSDEDGTCVRFSESVVAPDGAADIKDDKDDANNTTSTDELLYTHPYGLDVDIPDVRGSVAAQYLPAEARPYHRPIANYGRRIDTIRWTRRRLIELSREIAQIRKRLRSPHCKSSETIPVAFVEFESQEAAQAAHQVLAHHQPLHMAPRLLGVRPDEVVWEALRIKWLERIIRRFGILGLIVAAIIFWSIPSAIVGVISNIQELSRIPFLRWLNDLPSPILGLLTGFVPALALSLFMSLVPIILRGRCLCQHVVPIR